MIRLYDYPDCPFCQKVRVVLAEKDLEYETKAVDLRAGEQRTPEFLKLNPYGKVPVLVDDETVVYDSTIINEYLEDEYPHPELLPEDSASRAKARLLEDYCDTSFIPSADFVILQLSKPEGERDEERLKRYQLEVERGLARLEPGDHADDQVPLVDAVAVAQHVGFQAAPRAQLPVVHPAIGYGPVFREARQQAAHAHPVPAPLAVIGASRYALIVHAARRDTVLRTGVQPDVALSLFDEFAVPFSRGTAARADAARLGANGAGDLCHAVPV